MLINCPVCTWLHKQGDNLNVSFVCRYVRGSRRKKKKGLYFASSWLCLWNKISPLPSVLPLWYDLVGIGEVAVDVLHLEWVSVTDLVIGSAVVGRLDHNDITPRAAEINCISFTWELPPDQPERQGRTDESWQRHKDRDKTFREIIKLKGSLLQYNKTTHHAVKIHWHKINRQRQSNVYHSFKQTSHYTRYRNGERQNNSSLHLSVVLDVG